MTLKTKTLITLLSSITLMCLTNCTFLGITETQTFYPLLKQEKNKQKIHQFDEVKVIVKNVQHFLVDELSQKLYVTKKDGNNTILEVYQENIHHLQKPIWSYTFDKNDGIIENSISLVQNRYVLAISSRGMIYLLDDQGKLKWKKQFKTSSGQPLITNQYAFFRLIDGSIHAVSLITGETHWNYKSTSFNENFSLQYQQQENGLLYLDGMIYAGIADGGVVALEEQTGIMQWKQYTFNLQGLTDIERLSSVLGKPFKNLKAKNDEICVAIYQRGIQCLDRKTGQLKASLIQKISSIPEIDSQNIVFENQRFDVISVPFPLQEPLNMNWQTSLQDENVMLKKRTGFFGLLQSIQNDIFVTGEHNELYALDRETGSINYAVGLPSSLENFKPFYWSNINKITKKENKQQFLMLFKNKQLILGQF